MSPSECGVSEYDCVVSVMMRPWPTGGYRATEQMKYIYMYIKHLHAFLCIYIYTHVYTKN